ncbi:hypothetical protein [Brevundimonas diminuta]|uniref:hypothetical protein n=1 Tax=Brevundimonas diminuta TaxID=293 RepID=UPI001177FAA1|nr:hypothetical protein [Brevundimonas diminuta]WQE44706.1 hypothetical protein U0020_14095 [Brevundimonas diminuta]
MRKVPPSLVLPDHPDHVFLERLASEIDKRLGARPADAFVGAVVEAIEFVLDPIRTGRTTLSELDNVEKTFIGLKIEHFVRDLLDADVPLRISSTRS